MVRACKPPARGAGKVLVGASLDDCDVGPGEGQFASEHQPGRAAAGNHYRVLGHPLLLT